jgi:hypothetical protein
MVVMASHNLVVAVAMVLVVMGLMGERLFYMA